MTVLSVTVPCTAGGTTQVTLNFESIRSGSSNDSCAFRIVRSGGGQPDYVLASAPQFVLTSSKDVRSWSFIDTSIPVSADMNYRLQIMKLNGGGTFYSMLLSAIHYRK